MDAVEFWLSRGLYSCVADMVTGSVDMYRGCLQYTGTACIFSFEINSGPKAVADISLNFPKIPQFPEHLQA